MKNKLNAMQRFEYGIFTKAGIDENVANYLLQDKNVHIVLDSVCGDNWQIPEEENNIVNKLKRGTDSFKIVNGGVWYNVISDKKTDIYEYISNTGTNINSKFLLYSSDFTACIMEDDYTYDGELIASTYVPFKWNKQERQKNT